MSDDRNRSKSTKGYSASKDFVTFEIANQLFGIFVLKVQDILSHCNTTRIPLAPPEIAGSLNLRGRIVTAIDVRRRLNLPERDGEDEGMSIVVEHEGELYSLIVDTVGEVLPLSTNDYERNPPTMNPRVREYSEGIYRLKEGLLVVLDVDRLLDYGTIKAA
jgi:purine-binding chemotaxis protein CheW|tara:strand:- start:3934 stop:4416 length:483 start_codon:yes stop_codon:yes gene_type:complete